MSNITPSYLGADNTLATTAEQRRALFYKLFTGEVLTAFDRTTVMATRHRQRNITSGKSAAFANTGRATAGYHVPGTELSGQTIAHGETVITVDDLLLASVFIANIDEAMNHYEVRGEYSRQLGQALARAYDKMLLRTAIQAARSANAITSLPGGTGLGTAAVGQTLATGHDTASDLVKAQNMAQCFFNARKRFANIDVPTDGIFALVTPDMYFNLVQNKELLNRDWGGAGSFSDASIPQVAGIPLVVTSFLPSVNDVAGTAPAVSFTDADGDVIHNKYVVNSTKTRALIMTPEAVGSVNLMDLSMESEYQIRRQGTLMVAKRLFGAGKLRPECAFEIVAP